MTSSLSVKPAMWGVWQSSPATEHDYRTVEHICRLRGITMAQMIDMLIRDMARTPFCEKCGSNSLEYREDEDFGEDGKWPYAWTECIRCGARQEERKR